GQPLTALIATSRDDGLTVIELSSFQLEAVEQMRLFAAVLLNITPDHLDRYASMDDYAAAKSRIFVNQTPDDLAVLNADDERVARMSSLTKAHVVYFSRERQLDEGICLRGDEVVSRSNGRERVLITREEIGLRGAHNLE